MFVSIGEIANHGPRRTLEPVRKHSKPAGRCEGVFFRRTSRQEARQIVLAARRYEVTGKAAGSRNGPLGGVALEVLDYLANRIDYRTGRLEPSLDTMMRVLGVGTRAVRNRTLRSNGAGTLCGTP